MAFLQLKDVSLAFADRDILIEANLTLTSERKAALAGVNGSGKTTLLRLLAGLVPPDSGQIVRPDALRLAYLPQSGIVAGRGSVFDDAERAFDRLRLLAEESESLTERAASAPDDEAMSLLTKSHELQEQLEFEGWYRRHETIEQTLRGLGFASTELTREVAKLSGGWQMRVALARCLLEKPDILLLDEPTNYLDLEAKEWLEAFLKRYNGGFFLVSHDRGFLDAVVNEVVEIARGHLTAVPGNYSNFEKRREEQAERLQEAWKRQQIEIERQEAYINRFRAQATKASGVQSRIKQLDKIERIEIPESASRVHFHFPPAPHSGRDVLTLRDLRKTWGGVEVFSGLDLDVEKGLKVALTGRNGAGKSTLMRILAGLDPMFEGTLRWGTDVTQAYFSQDHEKHLDPQRTVLEELEIDAPAALYPRLRDLLGAFLFNGDDVEKKTAVLSGGEKNRLTLVKLLLKPANVLLLDEPTNHLDLTSKDVLLEALQKFTGTVFVVSHDKYFLSHLVDRVLELTPNGPMLHLGGWPDYVRRLEAQTSQLSEKEAAQPAPRTQSQTSREEVKKRQALIKRLQKDEEATLEQIEALETEHLALNQALSDPANYTDGAKMRAINLRLTQLDNLVHQAHEKWESCARDLEALTGS